MNSQNTEILKKSSSQLINFELLPETEHSLKKEVFSFEIKSTNEKTTLDSILRLTKMNHGYIPELMIEDLPTMPTPEETIAKYAEWMIRFGQAIQKENELGNFTNIKI